jgi:diguanylate cyclase (GGDEF)-like protein/PAS domain S-box-containing protein
MNKSNGFSLMLGPKLAILFLVLTIIPLMVVGYLAYSTGADTIEHFTTSHLFAVNTLKEGELNRWIDDSKADLRVLARSPLMVENAVILAALEADTSDYQAAYANISAYQTEHIQEDEESRWIALFLLQASDGSVLASTIDSHEGSSAADQPCYLNGRQETYVRNVFYSDLLGVVTMEIATPIMDETGAAAAVLVGMVDLAELTDIMTAGSRFYESEETYLVNDMSLLVTETRYTEDLAMKVAIETEGVEACLTNQDSGFGLYNDYREVGVIEGHLWIEERDLCILTEVDQSEAFASVIALRNTLFAIGVGLALIATLAAILIARNITEPVQKLVQGTQEIGQGNLDHHIVVSSRDEIGHLADAFNEMTAERKKADRVLRDSQQLLEKTFSSLKEAVLIIDASSGLIVSCNPSVSEVFGYDEEEIHGRSTEFLHIDKVTYDHFMWELMPVLDSGDAFHSEFQMQRKSGDVFFSEITVTEIRNGNGERQSLVYVIRDITDRKQAESELRLLDKVFGNTIEGIVITDSLANIITVNEAFTDITGYTQEDVVGKNPRLLKSDYHSPEFYKKMWDDLLTDGQWHGELRNRRKSGEVFPGWQTISAVKNDQGNTTHYVSVVNDITQIKKAEERLQHLATHDVLTSLPNRNLFQNNLNKAMMRAQQMEMKAAVVFINLDRFTLINDTLGQEGGDEVLKAVAGRLQTCKRDNDTAARMGSDEFTLILEDLPGPQEAQKVAERVLEKIGKSMTIDGHDFIIPSSIGISLYPGDGEDAQTLLNNATAAMARAKQQGGSSFQFYTKEMSTQSQNRLVLENNLRHALERDELRLYYQPQVVLKGRKIVAAEALIRWQHPELGLVSPAKFIPLAEETGLILPIGEWVIRTACTQIKTWWADGLKIERVAVNLSARQFVREGLPDLIAGILDENGLPPHALEVEITESLLMDNTEDAISTLKAFRTMGLNISLDDFGTGYSSLSYLNRFPISMLKVDQSFVRNIGDSSGSAAIVKTIIAMAKSLNLEVIAEGVETEDQLNFLDKLDCDFVQGYFFYRPEPADQVAKYLK